ncbi:patatin-like phospholipase family protein [Algoriphagus aquatilis]|uniref:Patatin-like phospholipase family protein n=1 Tax=Algoriphagus aquatilis TaxID=490186 RepID=A0ABW0BYU3_9BACT
MKDRILYSFPVQLLLLHLRKNLALLLIWGLLILIVSENFGVVLGIPFLFLDPEYLHEVSWLSFFLMGIGLAMFTMAFHMTTYILEGRRFKFLAVLRRPFIHFCVNNSIVPFAFYLFYTIRFVAFQLNNDLPSDWDVVSLYLGFAIGSILAYALIFSYFGLTNKDFFLIFSESVDQRFRKARSGKKGLLSKFKTSEKEVNTVKYYLNLKLNLLEVSPDISKFETAHLLRVFNQNHLHLFFIQVFLVSLVWFLGIFKEQEILQFPAAMSAMLLLSILVMAVGAISFWLRKWATFVVFSLILLANYFSNFSFLNRPHEAFGLDYSAHAASYTLGRLDLLTHQDTVEKDKENVIRILENWKAKFPNDSLPKLVIVSASGGGQRAALWTLRVLQEIHKVTHGTVTSRSALYTGASGGVLGEAFFRELYLRSQTDQLFDPSDSIFLDQIASDNLNPIIFTLLVNDLLIRNQKFDYRGRGYLKDRGFAFEDQLNKNTKGILDKPLKDYREPEAKAQIPMMPVTALITNDGRKLVISPHSMSFLGVSAEGISGKAEKKQSIDFRRFFENHDPDNLRFLSALRMSATFPFVTPNVELPSNPVMKTMDTGLSDNFGIQDALRFVYVFKDWIAQNTSGVVMITIRDSEKNTEIPAKELPRILEKVFTPLKNIYVNWDNVQTIQNEVLFNYLSESMPFGVERIEFEYAPSKILTDSSNGYSDSSPRASLNWRLTASEKKSIVSSLNTRDNMQSLKRLVELFGDQKK